MIHAIYSPMKRAIILVSGEGSASFSIPEEEAASLAVSILHALGVRELPANAQTADVELEPADAWASPNQPMPLLETSR